MIILSFEVWKLMDIVVHNHWLMLTSNISIKTPDFLLVNTSSTLVVFDFICLQARVRVTACLDVEMFVLLMSPKLPSRLHPAPCEFVEQLFIQLLVTFFASHREENVAADEFMNNFAVSGQALEI